jgi:hypothetical protein
MLAVPALHTKALNNTDLPEPLAATGAYQPLLHMAVVYERGLIAPRLLVRSIRRLPHPCRINSSILCCVGICVLLSCLDALPTVLVIGCGVCGVQCVVSWACLCVLCMDANLASQVEHGVQRLECAKNTGLQERDTHGEA